MAPKRESKPNGMTCRGVVTFLNARTLWGKLVYAPTETGHAVIDAISAALIVTAKKAVRQIRQGQANVVELEFHLTAWHGATWSATNPWRPKPGEIVQVRLNADHKLVSVWYASR